MALRRSRRNQAELRRLGRRVRGPGVWLILRQVVLCLVVRACRRVRVRGVNDVYDASFKWLTRNQLEMPSWSALCKQLEARPGGRGVYEQMQLIEQTCVEQLPDH